MAEQCLKLVGAGYADAVGLLNELNRRSNEMEKRAKLVDEDRLRGVIRKKSPLSEAFVVEGEGHVTAVQGADRDGTTKIRI
jgi:hypothetical protein